MNIKKRAFENPENTSNRSNWIEKQRKSVETINIIKCAPTPNSKGCLGFWIAVVTANIAHCLKIKSEFANK